MAWAEFWPLLAQLVIAFFAVPTTVVVIVALYCLLTRRRK